MPAKAKRFGRKHRIYKRAGNAGHKWDGVTVPKHYSLRSVKRDRKRRAKHKIPGGDAFHYGHAGDAPKRKRRRRKK